MITIGCATACIASSVSSKEEIKKAMQLKKCNWQENSEKLNELRDRSPKALP